jgi:hypothetical protein
MGAAIMGVPTTVPPMLAPAHGSQHCTGWQHCVAAGWRLPKSPPPRVVLWKQPDVPAVSSARDAKIRSLRIVLSPGRKGRVGTCFAQSKSAKGRHSNHTPHPVMCKRNALRFGNATRRRSPA